MHFHKHRFAIFHKNQHPYKHALTDFAYSNPALPNVSTLQGFADWMVAVLYPNAQASVANVAALPTMGNTINDYRIVLDDGDGKAASYRWEQREGDVSAKWYKIYDMDWGESTILSNFLNKTQDVYSYKYGIDDLDDTGTALTGVDAGQHFYGGQSANTHLTLHANSGDGTGANTGYVQTEDHFRPTTNNAIDVGEASTKFRTGYFGTSLLAGDMTISDGSIISSSGAISFGDENLTTTGSITSAGLISSTALTMAQIATPANPSAGYDKLYFKSDDKLYRLTSAGTEALVGLNFTSSNDNRLIKSDGTGGDAIQESGITVTDTDEISGVTSFTVDNLNLNGNSIISTDLNGDINLTPNGTGAVVVPKLQHSGLTNDTLMTVNGSGVFQDSPVTVNGSGVMSGVTQLNVDNLRLDGNTLSSTDLNGNLTFEPNGTGVIQAGAIFQPVTDASFDLGVDSKRFQNIKMSGSIGDGTNTIAIATLLSFRDALVGASSGMALFYDGSKWNASIPDTEVDHGTVTGLGDDDHSQYLLLAGRSGGQSIIGGTDASDGLTLESTSNVTKGLIQTKDNFVPFTDASYSAGWNGTDLGGSSNFFRDLYMKGEAKNFRLENFTVAGLPAASANNEGRIMWATDSNDVYVDNGGALQRISVNKHLEDLTFNGSDLTKTVDVSANITDARKCIIQLLDNTNDFERINCQITATSATDVVITTNVALPAGSYRLICIE